MFSATERETLILKTLFNLSEENYCIEENEFFSKLNEKFPEIKNSELKNAIEGCTTKKFMQKCKKDIADGKIFYEITEDGKKQI